MTPDIERLYARLLARHADVTRLAGQYQEATKERERAIVDLRDAGESVGSIAAMLEMSRANVERLEWQGRGKPQRKRRKREEAGGDDR